MIGVENKIEDSPYDDDETTNVCKRYFSVLFYRDGIHFSTNTLLLDLTATIRRSLKIPTTVCTLDFLFLKCSVTFLNILTTFLTQLAKPLSDKKRENRLFLMSSKDEKTTVCMKGIATIVH